MTGTAKRKMLKEQKEITLKSALDAKDAVYGTIDSVVAVVDGATSVINGDNYLNFRFWRELSHTNIVYYVFTPPQRCQKLSMHYLSFLQT